MRASGNAKRFQIGAAFLVLFLCGCYATDTITAAATAPGDGETLGRNAEAQRIQTDASQSEDSRAEKIHIAFGEGKVCEYVQQVYLERWGAEFAFRDEWWNDPFDTVIWTELDSRLFIARVDIENDGVSELLGKSDRATARASVLGTQLYIYPNGSKLEKLTRNSGTVVEIGPFHPVRQCRESAQCLPYLEKSRELSNASRLANGHELFTPEVFESVVGISNAKTNIPFVYENQTYVAIRGIRSASRFNDPYEWIAVSRLELDGASTPVVNDTCYLWAEIE